MSIPLDELADLARDPDIVAHCRSACCVVAHNAVRPLTDRRSAMRPADGMLECVSPICRSRPDRAVTPEPTHVDGSTRQGIDMPTATAGEARIAIDAAPLTVYELVSDISRMGQWSPECYRCEWLDGATTAVAGARFRGHNRLGKVRWHTDAVITVADPGQEFAFTTLHKGGREETLWRYQFRQVADGTEVIESYQFLWCPIANRIAELPLPRDKQLRRGIQETLHRIKAAAEQCPPQTYVQN